MNIQLDVHKIFNKEFRTALRGYDKEDVDEFLDLIIQDYDAFNQRIEQLEREVDQLKQYASKQPERPQPSPANYDILRRLAHLENHVFGDKLNGNE